MDELYILARRVLLDALEALGPHRNAIVLVGAQALYLRAGEADLAVAPYTTDADLAFDPSLLGEIPPLEQALSGAGFMASSKGAVGVWITRRTTSSVPDVEVQVDLLVPQGLSPGKGRRAARLPGHDPTAARIVEGLEGAVVDQGEMPIASLDPVDPRVVTSRVAGPAALLVAKLYKIADRKGTPRSGDKDALDVLRLLRGVPIDQVAERMQVLLADPRSAATAGRGIQLLRDLFLPGGEGTRMAARAVVGRMDEQEIRVSCELLAGDLLKALGP